MEPSSIARRRTSVNAVLFVVHICARRCHRHCSGQSALAGYLPLLQYVHSHIVSVATTGTTPDTSSTACSTHSFVPGDVTGTVAGNGHYSGISTAAAVRASSCRIICDNRHYSPYLECCLLYTFICARRCCQHKDDSQVHCRHDGPCIEVPFLRDIPRRLPYDKRPSTHEEDTFFFSHFSPRLDYAGSPGRTRGKKGRGGP